MPEIAFKQSDFFSRHPDQFIHQMNVGPVYNDKAYNPDEWLRLFRVYGTPGYMAAHLRSFVHWIKVNGRWMRK